MLWFGRTPAAESAATSVDAGADEMEIVGAQERSEPAELPGSRELDDALAALDALAPAAPTAAEDPRRDEDESWPPASETVTAPIPGPEDEPEVPASTAGSLTSLTRPPTTPATRAYRRLRRIFPG